MVESFLWATLRRWDFAQLKCRGMGCCTIKVVDPLTSTEQNHLKVVFHVRWNVLISFLPRKSTVVAAKLGTSGCLSHRVGAPKAAQMTVRAYETVPEATSPRLNLNVLALALLEKNQIPLLDISTRKFWIWTIRKCFSKATKIPATFSFSR